MKEEPRSVKIDVEKQHLGLHDDIGILFKLSKNGTRQ